MENKDQEIKTTKDPQPSDQVQLEIETVTPDTEKDIVPTTNSGQLAKEAASANGQKEVNNDDKTTEDDKVIADKADQSSEAETLPKVESEEQSDDMKDKSDEAATSTAKSDEDISATKEDENDERDQIETVSP